MSKQAAPLLSSAEAVDIKAAVLDAARISEMEPVALALSLVEAFNALKRSTSPTIESAR